MISQRTEPNMCSYITCVLGNWTRIIVLNVEAAVVSAHGVCGYSVVRRWMMVVIVRTVYGSTVEQLC